LNGATAIVALIKRGKKGIIKIRKLRNRGKHNKGKRGTYGKKRGQHSKESAIKNLLK
jgi:hypothetical protein